MAGLTLFWGGNWPMMKIVLAEIPVWPFRSLCVIGGGCALLLLVRLSGQSIRVPTSEVRPLLICALFNTIAWHLFSGYGVSLIEAGRAVIIAFTMPVWAAVLSRVILGEAFTRWKLLGLLFGMAGLAVLIGPDLRALGAAPLGALFMLGAAVSWATGTVLMKHYSWSIPVGVLAGWQLLVGSVPLVIGALVIGDLPNPSDLSLGTLAALAYILVFPMTFCHWAWTKLVRIFPATLAAVGTLAIPVVGVLSSALILGEPLGAREAISLALVCAALAFVLVIPGLTRKKAES
jgi:drug/metabolite transporter (DMT)-like permease